MLEHANRRPSGRALSAIGHRFGTLELRELLAVRGEAGLWRAVDDDGRESLLRLYPGLPTLGEWHALELATSRLIYAADAALVPVEEVALDVWPRLRFACAGAEPLSRRIAREPMDPAAAVALCADVAGALAALERVGVPPVDIGAADIVLVGERAGLLADVGLPGGRLAHACVDLDHVAPERAAAIAERAQGEDAPRGADAYPTAASMSYALASIVATAIHGPRAGGAGTAPAALPARLEQVLRHGLAHSPSERYATPAALADALAGAIGVRPRRRDASTPRGTRRRGVRAAVAPRPARTGRRRAGVALLAAVLLGAAAIGAVAGSASTAPRQPAAVALTGAGLGVEAPRGWLRAGAGAVPPAFGSPVLVAHPPATDATALVVTRTAAPLLARLADAAPEPVRLGVHDAWRYRDVAVGAASTADVYVLEDGDGPIVAACVGPPAADAAARAACSAALTTLRLPAGPVVPLGGDAATRRALAGIVADLDQARARERHALAAASTGRRQAAAADRLGAAYARAAAASARLGTVGAPGELARLAGRLGETGRAYAALATAARATHRRDYARARHRVTADERALQRDIAALA